MHRESDHRKFALQRNCGVCRHFVGASIKAAGDCLRHGKATTGSSSAGRCDDWTRRIAGVDPLPWETRDAILAAPIEEALEIAAKIELDIETPLTPDEIAGAVAFMSQPLDLAPTPKEPSEIERAFEAERRPRVTVQERAVQDVPRVAPKPAREAKPGRAFSVDLVAVEARRERLRMLAALTVNLTAGDAAAALDLPAWQIRSDAKAIGLELSTSPASRFSPAVRDLRERVKTAFDGKRTIAEIAEIVGAHVRTVRGHLDALELVAPAGRPGKPKGQEEAIEARRSRLRDLVQERRLSRTELAAALGISSRTLSVDLAAIGVTLPAGRSWPPAPPPAAVASIEELAADRADRATLLERGEQMIRLARQTSLALYSLADELEVWLKNEKGSSNGKA